MKLLSLELSNNNITMKLVSLELSKNNITMKLVRVELSYDDITKLLLIRSLKIFYKTPFHKFTLFHHCSEFEA